MIIGSPVFRLITAFRAKRDGDHFAVTQPFGPTDHTGEPPLGKAAHFHRGIDLGNFRCGYAVLAVADGTVRYSGKLSNGENVVVIRHGDGWASSYGHLADREVSAGQGVKKGDKIGDHGTTGFSSACHLHFALKKGLDLVALADFIPNRWGGRGDTTGEWVDPWPLLEQNVKIRLVDADAVRLRAEASTSGLPLAFTRQGRIFLTDGTVDVGSVRDWREWGGRVTGGSYTLAGAKNDRWHKIRVGSQWLFVAAPLAELSAE